MRQRAPSRAIAPSATQQACSPVLGAPPPSLASGTTCSRGLSSGSTSFSVSSSQSRAGCLPAVGFPDQEDRVLCPVAPPDIKACWLPTSVLETVVCLTSLTSGIPGPSCLRHSLMQTNNRLEPNAFSKNERAGVGGRVCVKNMSCLLHRLAFFLLTVVDACDSMARLPAWQLQDSWLL